MSQRPMQFELRSPRALSSTRTDVDMALGATRAVTKPLDLGAADGPALTPSIRG